MSMSSLMKRAMPDVRRFASRNMNIPTSRTQLESRLLDWLQETLDYIGQDRAIHGVRPATYLVTKADGIDLLLNAGQYAPPTMQLDANGNGAGRTVYANFAWGVGPDGHWYIQHVKFGLSISDSDMNAMEKRALKERLFDKAEAENARRPRYREWAFPAEQYVNAWENELEPGNKLVRSIDATVYGWARQVASLPENPFTPYDIALGFIPDANRVNNWGHADVIGDLLPGASGLIKMFAAMLCQVATANMAGEVARIRGRVYVCFTAGLVTGVTLVGGTTAPPNKLDKEYYEKGLNMAHGLNDRSKFQLQLSLLNYSRTYYTDQFWEGWTYESRGIHSDQWDFPAHWIAKWSPPRLGAALITQFWQHGIK